MKSALMFALALSLCSPATADTLKKEELRPFTDRIMDDLSNSDTAATLRKVIPYVAMSESEFEAMVGEATSTHEKYRREAGKRLAFHFFSEKQIGDALTRLTYGERAAQLRLTWVFFFSKTPDGWILNKFHAH